MTVKLLLGDEIRSTILKILSGECVFVRRPQYPTLYVVSPWLSDVTIDFSERHVSREREAYQNGEKKYSFLLEDYNIKSINLSYALLLFKLHSACNYYQHTPQINIVTLPPDERSYSAQYVPRIRTLLAFLDEIGCNVFLNSNLHSKVLLANDLALLGSFNFTSSALLYDREEIGVSINDLDNLEALEDYCWKVMHGSERFGYNSLRKYGKLLTKQQEEFSDNLTESLSQAIASDNKQLLDRLVPQITELNEERFDLQACVTRGWLLDLLIQNLCPDGYGEFLNITGGYDKFVASYASDLNLFYLMSIRRLVTLEEGRELLVSKFHYCGDGNEESIMEFINRMFARPSVPFVKLQVEPLFLR